MQLSPRKINQFLLVKLPLAWLAGVRVKSMNNNSVTVTVKHKWINQNPYKSMFWAVQGMAAELTTGVLMMKAINNSGKRISMLVTNQQGSFTKKGTGLLHFECNEGDLIDEAIKKSIDTKEGQTITLNAKGIDSTGDVVSNFSFEWSIKVKN